MGENVYILRDEYTDLAKGSFESRIAPVRLVYFSGPDTSQLTPAPTLWR